MSDEQATLSADQPPVRRVGFLRWVWRITAGTFAVVVVLLALFIGLFRVAVPLLPDFQERIEQAATRAIGYPLSVGSIDARWRLRGPELVFDDVTLRTSGEARDWFTANRLRVAIDALALVRRGELRPSSFTLTGAELTLRRDADGAWYVQGIPVENLKTDRRVAQPWGIANGEFGVENIVLTLNDEQTAREISLPDVDIEVVVQDTSIGLSGELEFERRGPRIQFSADAEGHSNQLDDVVWNGFASGNRIAWTELEKLIPFSLGWSTTDPVDLSLWVRAVGALPREASLSVNAQNVMAMDKQVTRVAGQFSWSGTRDSWQLVGEQVDISSDPNTEPGTLRLGVGPRVSTTRLAEPDSAAELPREYTFSASQLSLDDLATLAVPVSERVATHINDFQPSGIIQDLEGFVVTAADAVTDFAVTASLTDVGMQATTQRPGFRGLTGRVFGSRASGGLQLHRLTELSMPGVLRRAITPDKASALLTWAMPGEGLRVRVSELELETPDLTVGGTAILERPRADSPWEGDMDLSVDNLVLAEAYHYFPTNRFSDKLLKWLDNALKGGTGTNGRFELRGPLNKFPFVDPNDGDFLASVELNDATLHYANNWPDATELNAEIVFERNSLRSQVDSARMLTLPIRSAQATIDDLKRSIVFIEGSVEGQLDDMRAFLDATPIVKNWGQGWRDSQIFGEGRAQLSLTIPTKKREDTAFDVALQFEQSRFQFRDWTQTITDLNGELRASRAGLTGDRIRGTFLGEPVTLGVRPATVEGYTSELTLQGVARPSSLARHLHESLADHLSGSTEWTAGISLPKVDSDALLQVRLRSPLQGMAVTLPKPLAKAAEETRFTDALLTVIKEDELSVVADYGDNTGLLARVREDSQGYWFVPTGELRLGGSNAVLPETDIVRVMGSADALDMSELVEFTQSYSADRPWLELDFAEVLVDELQGLGQSFGATRVRMTRDDDMRLEFVGDQLNGLLTVPKDITPETPIIGRFDSLQWKSSDEPREIDPEETPSIRAVVDSFRYNDFDLGALVVHLEARENLVAVREFTTTAPDFNTRTTGSWVFGNGESNTFLVSEFGSNNVQGALRALNQAEFLESGSASGRMEMSWPNGWTPDYLNTMEGDLSITIGQGKLVSVDPGAGRVFGLLSLGALPRRLNLDFRDVFDSGFGFDSITGDFTLREGNAVTDNLALSGPAANVVIIGRTGLIEKDYDQTAVVYANFGSSLPIAGAIAGGPAVGAALLVVTEIFKKPLQNMGKVSYSITGDWDAPVVARTGSARAPASGEAEDDGVDANGTEGPAAGSTDTPESGALP